METICLAADYSTEDIKSAVSEALKKQVDFAYARLNTFSEECRMFEKKYNMSSEDFLNKFNSGDIGDDETWFDWYATLKGKKIWGKKYNVLKDLKWKRFFC